MPAIKYNSYIIENCLSLPFSFFVGTAPAVDRIGGLGFDMMNCVPGWSLRNMRVKCTSTPVINTYNNKNVYQLLEYGGSMNYHGILQLQLSILISDNNKLLHTKFI